jgi:hypothetical protein
MKKLMKILIFLFFVLLMIGTTGCDTIDPCKREMKECNYSCGEGWLSGLCKAFCTDDYNRCKNVGGLR